MSWIRFDDGFAEDPAIQALGDDEAIAGWTYLRLCSWSARHLTDGQVPAGFLRREDAAGVAALVRVELLERRDDGSGYLPRFLDRRDADGQIVEYGHHPSKAEVEDRRQKRQDAGQLGGLASAAARAKANGRANGKHDLQPLLEQNASNGATPESQTQNPGIPESLPRPVPFSRARRVRETEIVVDRV